MIYEVRVSGFMSSKTSSLDVFFNNQEKAEEHAKRLNNMLPVYFVNGIKLEDSDGSTEGLEKAYEVRVSSFGRSGTSSLEKFYKDKENAQEYVDRLNTHLYVYSLKEIPLN